MEHYLSCVEDQPRIAPRAIPPKDVDNMIRYLRTWAIVFAVSAGVVGCTNDDDDDARIVRPDIPLGDGRAYPIENVVFNTVDGAPVPVSAVFGRIPNQSRLPAVILVHDIGSPDAGAEWLFSGFFEQLLDRQIQPLAIDLRGRYQDSH